MQKHTLRKLEETEGGNKICRSIHLGSWKDRGREQGIMQKQTLRKLERQREGTRYAEAYT